MAGSTGPRRPESAGRGGRGADDGCCTDSGGPPPNEAPPDVCIHDGLDHDIPTGKSFAPAYYLLSTPTPVVSAASTCTLPPSDVTPAVCLLLVSNMLHVPNQTTLYSRSTHRSHSRPPSVADQPIQCPSAFPRSHAPQARARHYPYPFMDQRLHPASRNRHRYRSTFRFQERMR